MGIAICSKAEEITEGDLSYKLLKSLKDALTLAPIASIKGFSDCFSPEYQEVLEKSQSEKIEFFYLLIMEDKDILGLACLQKVELNLQRNNPEAALNPDPGFLKQNILALSKKMTKPTYSMLICGNVFQSGNYGILARNSEDKKRILQFLLKHIAGISGNGVFGRAADLIMLKDVIIEKESQLLNEGSFTPFHAEPNMIMKLNPEWNSFENYLESLRTKYRVRSKKVLSKSKKLTVRDLNRDDISSYSTEIYILYKAVADRAMFNLQELNTDIFRSLSKENPDNFVFRAYFLEDRMIGFLSGLISRGVFNTHFIGLDYSLNKRFAIYPRMLLDYIEISIARRCQNINFGRTATEIKSTVGAIPQWLKSYVRHRNSLSNLLISPIFKAIQPSVAILRHPFRKTD